MRSVALLISVRLSVRDLLILNIACRQIRRINLELVSVDSDKFDSSITSFALGLFAFISFSFFGLEFWFDFCFTALQHILGLFGRGQFT